MSDGDLTERLRVNYALAAAELEETRKVRDQWCREYVKARDALAVARELIEALRVEIAKARTA